MNSLIRAISSCVLAMLLIGAAAHAQSTFTNVAFEKPTAQSSPGIGAPSRAVDGNTSGVWNHGSITHTDYEAQPWWTVSLGKRHYVDRVVIWNRTDTCCFGRLANFFVELLNETGDVFYSEFISASPAPSHTVNFASGGAYGVRVRLSGSNYLSLAEVQVFGAVSDAALSGYFSGDNDIQEFYLNGQSISLPHKANWKQADELIHLPLERGTNVLAVKVKDNGGPAGFIADIFADGYRQSTSDISPNDWKVSTTYPGAGWNEVYFDDSGWDSATAYGRYGVAEPWTSVSEVENFPSDSMAQWIWSSDNNNDNEIYLRYEISIFPWVWEPDAAVSPGLDVPECADYRWACNSGDLLDGRGGMTNGSESNSPNTLDGCADGYLGTYHQDESIDWVFVKSIDTVQLTEGGTAEIMVDWWAYSTSDFLDFYYTADAENPAWTYISTIQAPSSGYQRHSVQYTLPEGARQAVRVSLRYGGGSQQPSSACPVGHYSEADDLVFAVRTSYRALADRLGEIIGRLCVNESYDCPYFNPFDQYLKLSTLHLEPNHHWWQAMEFWHSPSTYQSTTPRCLDQQRGEVDCFDGDSPTAASLVPNGWYQRFNDAGPHDIVGIADNRVWQFSIPPHSDPESPGHATGTSFDEECFGSQVPYPACQNKSFDLDQIIPIAPTVRVNGEMYLVNSCRYDLKPEHLADFSLSIDTIVENPDQYFEEKCHSSTESLNQLAMDATSADEWKAIFTVNHTLVEANMLTGAALLGGLKYAAEVSEAGSVMRAMFLASYTGLRAKFAIDNVLAFGEALEEWWNCTDLTCEITAAAKAIMSGYSLYLDIGELHKFSTTGDLSALLDEFSISDPKMETFLDEEIQPLFEETNRERWSHASCNG